MAWPAGQGRIPDATLAMRFGAWGWENSMRGVSDSGTEACDVCLAGWPTVRGSQVPSGAGPVGSKTPRESYHGPWRHSRDGIGDIKAPGVWVSGRQRHGGGEKKTIQ
ncbi:predicted protein [Chaetomium globosum CBS 148.51]|uniref:Uncharacterized protein n=1 Tax=Chaetomium globosum (strain ATCC 6205 / CBS 148.51 / DSM 1962 / NBRC 6347 / NRRL 1970) TaxID=306901 RepID=Q2H5W5_CHAGB|nr:uncharacterized protein CHGG_05950 [Chaetomium globosum CBS 148.51]EAQ89331.1 predicted protein [Chaetomium globosum CBS 148.51]